MPDNELNATAMQDTLTLATASYAVGATPTVAASSNVASSANGNMKWFRLGPLVVFAISIEVTPTAGATDTYLRITPPVASAFTNSRHGFGAGSAQTAATPDVLEPVAVLSYGTDDQIEIDFVPASTAMHVVRVFGVYQIL